MTPKETNIQLKDVLHYHIKCWGRITQSNNQFYTNGEWGLSGGVYHAAMIGELNFIPHLRPLSDMTEEECLLMVNNILYWSHLSDEGKIHQIKELFASNGYYNKLTNLSGSQWNKIINYCRSIGIDMDGLIESGQAIDKTLNH